MKNWHYFHGQWVTDKDLKISLFDLSVIRGFGIFDFFRTYNRRPFLLEDHLSRFFTSANLLSLKIPKTKKQIKEIIFEGINKNLGSELNIKIILTGGGTKDGITPIGNHLLIVIFTPAIEYPKRFYQKGIKVITIKANRFLSQAKSLNYTAGVLAMIKAKKEGAEEVLYLNNKEEITEATRSNFFVVINNVLITPKKDILPGVTRNLVIKLAKKLKIPVAEEKISLLKIKKFQEAFITSTTKGIMPVAEIDDFKINNGKVGRVTKKLINEFKNFTRNY